MKIFSPNIRLLIALGMILLIITIGHSYLEYRSSRKAVLNLFKNHAQSLIGGVAEAGGKGLVAYQSLQRQIRERLYTIAATADMLAKMGKMGKNEMANIIETGNLSYLVFFDASGDVLAKYPSDAEALFDAPSSRALLSPIFKQTRSRIDLGFIDAPEKRKKIFAVAMRDHVGGAIVVGIDASELLILGRTFGAGSAIEDIARSTNVKYAALLNNGLILAATKDFPGDDLAQWPDKIHNRDTVITRLVEYVGDNGNANSVFEAMGPFYVADQYYGDILIGIDTAYLNSLTAKLKSDIGWKSVFSLVITLVAIAGIVLRQNYKLLSDRYDEIKEDVLRLEADKAIKAKHTAMGELAAGVAHEIRNPLNAIQVIVQRLRREFKPQTDQDEYDELTDVVKKEVDKINESIEQFLKMAKPPALTRTTADLNSCITDVLSLFNPRALKRDITIERCLGKLPEMKIDTKLCSQAILNLLENALAAVGRGGKIEIKTYFDKKRCFIEIGDSGPGIPDELKRRVFDMYFTTRDSGTGMGLPTVLMIVREHGGSIEILDSPLGGALFRVELPVEK